MLFQRLVPITLNRVRIWIEIRLQPLHFIDNASLQKKPKLNMAKELEMQQMSISQFTQKVKLLLIRFWVTMNINIPNTPPHEEESILYLTTGLQIF